jgi:hypothetical protein
MHPVRAIRPANLFKQLTMKRYMTYLLLVATSYCTHKPVTRNAMSWTDKTLYTDVRISLERDQMRIDLIFDNRSGADVFVPDVSFLSSSAGVKLNPAYLPIVVNGSNTLEVNLFVHPLDPATQWAAPPTFFTHIVRSQDRYQRQWILPYPVRIPAKDNHGMARAVPVSTDFVFNLGVIRSNASTKPKEVTVEGQTLYEFGQEALRFQEKQHVVLQNKAISLRVEE